MGIPNLLSKKRIFLQLFAVLFLFSSLITASYLVRRTQDLRKRAQTVTKPNVLIFMVDDLDENTFNQLLSNNKLPNIKKYLIDKGVRFTNSFVVDSICCSSRATLVTGKYPHNMGVYNVLGWEGGLRGLVTKGIAKTSGGQITNVEWLPSWLKQTGYKTGHIGKFMNTFEYGPGIKPGYDFWRNVRGYDSRPGMYDVVNNEGSFLRPDLYQAKYISDAATTSFLDNLSSSFFLVLAPHTPHISLASWSRENDGAFDDNIANPSSPIVGYASFDHPDPNILIRKHIIKGDPQNGYSYYSNDKNTSGAWSGWFISGDPNKAVLGTGDLPIVAWNAFVHPDINGIRQHLIRGTLTDGYSIYYRDIVGGQTGSWIYAGKVSDEIPGTGSLPVAGIGFTNLKDQNIIQYILRGTPANGYELYHRARIDGSWIPIWIKEAEGWDTNSGTGPIVEFDARYLGNGIIELQFIRQDEAVAKYIAYKTNIRTFYEDIPQLSVLGTNTFAKSSIAQATSFKDEADLFSSPSNTQEAVEVGSTPQYPHINWGGRVYADGNWINVKSTQSFPLTLYGGKYPAGSLRQGNDPNGFVPISSDFDLPHLGSTNFNNSSSCTFKHPWLCKNWPDLNQNIIGGKKQLDYTRRQHLDRLESMISIDVMIGEVMKKLDEKGLMSNTLIIFTSDNGFFMGEFRLGNKVLPYEDSIRVPLIIRPPNTILTSGKVNQNTVLNIDLTPTILDYANLSWDSPTYNVDGRSLRNLITNSQPLINDWRKWFEVEFRYPRNQNNTGPDESVYIPSWQFVWAIPDFQAIRVGLEASDSEAKNYLYAQYTDDPLVENEQIFYELYDMNSDPVQNNNIYSNSSQQAKIDFIKEIYNKMKNCIGESCRSFDTNTQTVSVTPEPTVLPPTTTPVPTAVSTSIPTTVPTVKILPGDSDNDGNVDEADYAIWLMYYDPVAIQEGGASIGDFNGDSKVDGIDYTIWLNNYTG